MSDDNDLHFFGTALPELQIDDLPAKRAPYVEEQVAKDEYGRRRFHGAFTGGFSAGYWNTVGSQEGWQPQDFISSRHDKAEQRQPQRPENFMDAEDLGEFGIAPQRLQAQDDFAATNSKKRKFPKLFSGPIPGVPVLAQISAPVQDKVAVRILKCMGWRPGQGVGPRQTYKQKKEAAQLNKREMYLMEQYGFQPDKKQTDKILEDSTENSNEEADEDEDDEITFAPDDYDPYVVTAKENRFGLGYSGLNRDSVLRSQNSNSFSLFEPMQLLDKSQNRKFTISGQAFGVGALEEDDEDIYMKEDMTNYDFSVGDKDKQRKPQKNTRKQDPHVVEGFLIGLDDFHFIMPYKIDLPNGWKPRNWLERKTRFSPLDAEKALQLMPIENRMHKAGIGRHDITPLERGVILGEIKENKQTETSDFSSTHLDNKSSNLPFSESPGLKNNNYNIKLTDGMEQVQVQVQQEYKTLLEKCSEKTKDLKKSSLGFQPFSQNAEKQARYDKFVESQLEIEDAIREFLADIQPVKLSTWEREMELKEFIQARKIYKPLTTHMSNRFVSEGNADTIGITKKSVEVQEVMKINIERSKVVWKPCSALCKRYNIAEPYGKHSQKEDNELENQLKSKTKMSIFDYIDISVNSKKDFQTPVIIPKHIEELKPLIKQSMELEQIKEFKMVVQEEPKQSAVKRVRKTFKPQSDLEKRVEDTKEKPAAQKQELFKAIFESDDEKEQDAQETKSNEQNEEDKQEALLKTAKEFNLLREFSPPRGIFAAIFQRKEAIETENTIEPTTDVVSDSGILNYQPKKAHEMELKAYGPALPANFGNHLKTTTVCSKLTETKYSKINDEWVEKDMLTHLLDTSKDNKELDQKAASKKHKKHRKKKKGKHSSHKTYSEHKKKSKKHKSKK